MKDLPGQEMRRSEGGWRSSIHCSLFTILLGKYRFLSNTVQVQSVLCFASFLLCFRSPTVLVSNILEQSAVVLKRHSFICSLLPSFNSFQFSLTRLLPNVHLPQVHLSQCAQGRTSMLPREMLRSDRLCYPLSTCCLESFWTLPLARFLLPLIFSVSDYLCPDRLFLIECVAFFLIPLIWVGTKNLDILQQYHWSWSGFLSLGMLL